MLVTGARGGIGAAIAKDLAARGACVYRAGRPGSAMRETRVGPAPGRAIELDVTSEQDWTRTIDAIVSECGTLYGLVNNAGVLEPATPFMNLSLAQWRRHMAVNLDGAFMGTRLAMKAMAGSGGGAIVNISSGAAHIAVPDAAAYCVSKFAALTLTRLAAKAGGRFKVRVNAVLPGAVDTPMLWSNLQSGVEPGAFLESIARLHPIGRIGTTDDVATAVAFLLDPASGFITGAMLAVDGGQLVD